MQVGVLHSAIKAIHACTDNELILRRNAIEYYKQEDSFDVHHGI